MAQTHEIDSLKAELKKPNHDTGRVLILHNLSRICPEGEWQKYNLQKMQICEKNLRSPALSSLLKKCFNGYLAWAYYQQAEFYALGQTDTALAYYKKSAAIALQVNDTLVLTRNYRDMGNISARRGNFKEAASLYFKCLKLLEADSGKEKIGVLQSLGDLYRMQNDNGAALAYFNKALLLSEKIKRKKSILVSLNFIGLTYYEMENYTEGKKYYERALPLAEDDESLALIQSRLGYGIEHEGLLDSALHYYKKAFEIYSLKGDKRNLHAINLHLSNVYLKLKKNRLALSYGLKTLALANSLQYTNLIRTSSHLLYRIYKANGNADSALAFYERFTISQDSATSQNSKKAILEQKLNYEFEKKELLSKLEHDKKIEALKIKQQQADKIKNIWLMLLIALSLLLILSSYFLYTFFRQKSIINTQKNNILKQKLQLAQMNPHFIFNSLNAIQNYIFKEDKLKAGIYLAQFSELIRMILDFSRKDYITLASEERFLHNYLALQQIRFSKLSYTISIDAGIEKEHMLIPPMLAQPFVENSIEHGILKRAGQVDISISIQGPLLIYDIVDNGIGLENALALKAKLVSSYESLGTVITRERLNDLNAKYKSSISIEVTDLNKTNAALSGTRVRFSVPYKELHV